MTAAIRRPVGEDPIVPGVRRNRVGASNNNTMKTLHDLFLNELADVYDAERRIGKALTKIAKTSTCESLTKAVTAHAKETAGHIEKVERVFACFDIKPKGKTCDATVGLLEEGDKLAAAFAGSPALNAALVSVILKIEHYELSAYSCLRDWAGLLDNKEAANILDEIHEEERAAKKSITKLAVDKCYKDALRGSSAKGQGKGKRAEAIA